MSAPAHALPPPELPEPFGRWFAGRGWTPRAHQLALLIASPDAPFLFGGLRRVVLDEIHSLVTSKRGDLLALALVRLFRLSPGLSSVGLSATVADPDGLRRFLVPQHRGEAALADL